jgi:hypothetical protein
MWGCGGVGVWGCGVTPYVRHSTDCTCCDFGHLRFLKLFLHKIGISNDNRYLKKDCFYLKLVFKNDNLNRYLKIVLLKKLRKATYYTITQPSSKNIAHATFAARDAFKREYLRSHPKLQIGI